MGADVELDTFCSREWPRLVGALSLYTGDADIAEELAQETIARVCHHWHRVRRLDAPGAWAHRVAMNLANSHFRRRRASRRALERAANLAGPDRSGDDLASSVALRSAGLMERDEDEVTSDG